MGIVVLGMHRSGTSLLIGLLQVFGYHLGNVSNIVSELKPTGTKENIILRKLNNQILAKNGHSWDNPSCTTTIDDTTLAIMKRFSNELQKTKWAIKDPRLILTYLNWSNVLPNHKIIATLRHPKFVAQSLMTKNNMGEAKALYLWLVYNKALLSLWKQNPFPIINFDLCSDEYYTQLMKLEYYLNTSIEKESFVDFYKHKTIPSHLPSLDSFPEIMDVYQQLIQITKGKRTYG